MNINAQVVSSDSNTNQLHKKTRRLGFVLLDSSFRNLATSSRIFSAVVFTSDFALSLFSLELPLLPWREVLPPRPRRPPYAMTNDSFNTRTCDTQISLLCFWAG